MKLFRMFKSVRLWYFFVVRDWNFLNGGYYFNKVGELIKYKCFFLIMNLFNKCFDD